MFTHFVFILVAFDWFISHLHKQPDRLGWNRKTNRLAFCNYVRNHLPPLSFYNCIRYYYFADSDCIVLFIYQGYENRLVNPRQYLHLNWIDTERKELLKCNDTLGVPVIKERRKFPHRFPKIPSTFFPNRLKTVLETKHPNYFEILWCILYFFWILLCNFTIIVKQRFYG